ncbi:gamma-glutamylcyclotransferase [bacterium]|nr:gamma-glutamylcyclotransferase [bacterium]
MSHRLFVYGSLRDARVYLNVVGEPKPDGCSAVLQDFDFGPEIDGYPAIVPKIGASVNGELLDDINDAALAKIDCYEDNGVDYHRIKLWVATGETRAQAFVYVGTK